MQVALEEVRQDTPKLCDCGCGLVAPIAPKTRAERGWVRGKPLRYRRGHNPVGRRAPGPDYVVNPATGCWEWQRWKTDRGYGSFKRDGKQIRAHKYYFERYKGPVPEGKSLHHICGVRCCVNPEHIVAISHEEHGQMYAEGFVSRAEYERLRRMLADLGVDPGGGPVA